MNKRNEKKVVKTWSRASVIFPDVHRPHDRRLQRQEAHPGLRDREHGRPPARRVRPHPHLPRARQAHRALDGAEVGAADPCAFPPLPSTSAARPARPTSSPRPSAASRSRRPPPCSGSCPSTPPGTSRRVLKSATANAENNHNLSAEDLVVLEAHANEGPTIKRWRPRAQGRAFPIHKPMTHITIVVADQEA